jgi:hypothetical protein
MQELEWPNKNKAYQNILIESIWREHRKTREMPKTPEEAKLWGFEAHLMQDWFYANHDYLDTLTYARGLRLARMDEQSYAGEADYLTNKEAKSHATTN